MATAAVEQDVMQERAIEIYQPDAQVGELKLYRPPQKVLEEAKAAADSLQKVIEGSAIKPVSFGGESKHLRHEHWATLGHFYGYCTKIESVRYVEFGEARGFEATALLLHERTGSVVGRVTAMCLDEEDNWGEVAEYQWQDVVDEQGRKVWDRNNGRYLREKIQVGTKAKPLFQLQSMAETRASAKAYRLKLSWVAVLAGYNPTPAEEMSGDAPKKSPQAEELPAELKRKPAQTTSTQHPSEPLSREAHNLERPLNSAGCSQTQKPLTPNYQKAPTRTEIRRPSVKVITEGQARRFYALWKNANKTKAMVKDYLQTVFGIDDDRQIPADRYEEACLWAQG